MSTDAPVHPALNSHTRTFWELKQAFEVLDNLVSQQARLAHETAQGIRVLSEICVERFRIEEQAPLMEDVGDKAPWLQGTVTNFTAEHESLRKRLVSLCRCSQQQLPLPRSWQELSEELGFFKRQLATHEAAEGEFLQKIYGMDVGTKD